MSTAPVRLVLSDVDGTLLTQEKVLTHVTIDAVARLRDAGIRFAITSGRPPRGLTMLFQPLSIDTPIATFNGAMFIDRELNVLERRTLPSHQVGAIVEALESSGVDVWIYKGVDWLVRNAQASHVAKETTAVRFPPTVVPDFTTVTDDDDIAKIVGVSDDPDLLSIAESNIRERFGTELSITRSQPYYLDLTHPKANKGCVVDYLAERYNIPVADVATIGDMPTDVSMFIRSGLSVAMGNADSEVQSSADHVTTSNEDEGFATAVDRFILAAAQPKSQGW